VLCAIYGLFAQRAFSRMTPLVVTTFAMLSGALLLVPAALAESPSGALWSARIALDLTYLCTAGGALGYFLFTEAFNHIPATQVQVYTNLLPVIAALGGVLAFGERLSSRLLLGLVTVIGGVLLVQVQRRRAPATVRSPR
jgi:drug/metabolite transporter (DMT)-like permease